MYCIYIYIYEAWSGVPFRDNREVLERLRGCKARVEADDRSTAAAAGVLDTATRLRRAELMMSVVASREKRSILIYCGFIFILSVGFSGHHVGVEELWWAGPDSCSGRGMLSMEGLAAALNQSAQPSCQEPAARLFGISIAGYNLITSTILAGFCFLGVQREKWWNKQ